MVFVQASLYSVALVLALEGNPTGRERECSFFIQVVWQSLQLTEKTKLNMLFCSKKKQKKS